MRVNFRGDNVAKNGDWVNYVLALENVDREWLEAGWESILPPTLKNVEKAAVMLKKHLYSEGEIIVLIDNDCDGFTSSTLVYNWLKDMNPNKNIKPFVYEGKIHGIFNATEFPQTDLIIIPDAGSSQFQEMEVLAARGMDILIMDHHLTDRDMTNDQIVVVNPHLPDCNYPNKALSGCGVSWKVLSYYDEIHRTEHAKKYIDLVATANVADVMSMKTKENKAIINIGLKQFKNKFLQAIHSSTFSLADKEMTPIGIAFYIAPLINAVVRVGTAEDKIDLFNAFVGNGSPQNLIANFKKLKGSQDRQKEKAFMRIAMDLNKNGEEDHKVIMSLVPESLPKSMTGLIAGQIAGAYLRPAMLGRVNDKNEFVGSIRSLQNSNIEKFKQFCEDSGLMSWTAGHESACGFGMPAENMEKFIEYCDQNLPEFESVQEAAIDLTRVSNPKEVIKQVDFLGSHIGTDFRKVLLYNEITIRSNDIALIGKNKNTLTIKHDGITYIKFFFKGRDLTETPFGWSFRGNMLSGNVKAQIVGSANLNEWGGNITPQIIIEDFELKV